MTIRAEVPEADFVHLSPGMPLWFETLGRPDQKYDATLRQILPAPHEAKEGEEKTSGNVVNYIALFDVENADDVLMSGMTAHVFFVTARATDILPHDSKGASLNIYRVTALGMLLCSILFERAAAMGRLSRKVREKHGLWFPG